MKCEETCITVDALHKAIGGVQIEHSITVAELARWKTIPARLRELAAVQRQRAETLHECRNQRTTRCIGLLYEAMEADAIAEELERAADEAERIGRGDSPPEPPAIGDGGGL